jgi:gamma-polyglutamate synthase
LIFIIAIVSIVVCIGMWEFRTHQKLITTIPHRIHVNGTRGKSSVTRLISGGLRGGGMKAFAKTTGTKPRMIYPKGAELPIVRIGKANIIEQLKVVRSATNYQVDALVIECMAVLPANQLLVEKQMIRSTIGVITNVRADHLDEMGPTMDDVARSLSNTIPYKAILFTCEEKYLPVLQEVAQSRNTEVKLIRSDTIDDKLMKNFTYLEHKDNVALALAVCEYLHVPRYEALKGMLEATPDPGVLRIFRIHYYDKKIEFVNAFAANDPDSYIIIWNMLQSYFTENKKVLVIVNCRNDRIQRAESMAELIAQSLRADHIVLVGEYTTPLFHRAIALGLSESKITDLPNVTAEEVFQKVFSLTDKESMVIGIGNIVGYGEELSDYFTTRGKELVY